MEGGAARLLERRVGVFDLSAVAGSLNACFVTGASLGLLGRGGGSCKDKYVAHY